MPTGSFIALTDKAWFDFVSGRADNGWLDEVNFWSPKAVVPMRAYGAWRAGFLSPEGS